ncbi:MAG TPA: YfbK domain-containing protein, partial [Longimicrobium sp.]|nr:YfbK domain-containing protein [Longimicrobium sp.]
VPYGQKFENPGVDPLKYQEPVRPSEMANSNELMTVKLRYKEPNGDESRLMERAVRDAGRGLDDASDDLRFAAAVAQWGMLLRGSEHAGRASYQDVLELARGAVGRDEHGDRAGFVRLVQSSRRLARRETNVDERPVVPGNEDEDLHTHGR